MKKILLILTFILFSTLVYAGSNDKITEALNQYLQTKTIWISHN